MSTSSTSSTKSTSSQKKGQTQQQYKVTSTASSQSTSSSSTKNEISGVPRRTSINKSRTESPQQSDSERSTTNSAPGSMWVAINNKPKAENVRSKQNSEKITSPKLNDPTKRPAGGEDIVQRNKIAKSGKDSTPTSHTSQIRTSEIAGSSSNPKEAKLQPEKNINESENVKSDRTCPYCKQEFKFPSELRPHLKASENYYCKVTDCPEKKKKRCSLRSLKQHHKSEHAGIPLDFKGQYACNHPGCNKTFIAEHLLKNHGLYHSDKFKCHECGHTFNRKYDHQRHMEMRERYICQEDDCKNKPDNLRKFCTENGLSNHTRSAHNKEFEKPPGPYKCDYPECNKSYAEKSKLLKHLRERHSIETKK